MDNMTEKQERYGQKLLNHFDDDDFIDVLIRKLSVKDLDRLIEKCKLSEHDYLRRWCDRVSRLGLQKDKLAAIHDAAQPDMQ